MKKRIKKRKNNIKSGGIRKEINKMKQKRASLRKGCKEAVFSDRKNAPLKGWKKQLCFMGK
jgi:hypothetical protein